MPITVAAFTQRQGHAVGLNQLVAPERQADMNGSNNKRGLIAAAAATAVGVVPLLVVISQEKGGYNSPDAAVVGRCHAVHILGDYSVRDGRYRIGWQPHGAAPGTGWTAIVEHHGGGYEVIDCKFQGVTHG